LVDALRFQFGVDGLGQPGFGEANHVRAFDVKEFFQVRAGEVLHHRVMRKITQNFVASILRSVRGDEYEMQNAPASAQRFAADQQLAQLLDEREEALDGLVGAGLFIASFPTWRAGRRWES
jgi:hypothetical protein